MTSVFSMILKMNITASYVIIILLFARFLLKKAPKVISYALWSIVAFRLMVPFAIKTRFSLLPKNISGFSLSGDKEALWLNSTEKLSVGNYIPISPKVSEETMVNNSISLIWNIETLSYIWIVGVILFVIYYALSIYKIKKRLSNAVKVGEGVYETENISSPLVFGLLYPKIYLSKNLKKNEKDYILLHEKTHIRRKDPLVKTIGYILLCFHWLNPLVWIAFSKMSSDMELSCDERVLKEKGLSIRKSYALSLLSLSSESPFSTTGTLAFGNVSIKTRIQRVLNYKKARFWVLLVAIIAALGLTVTLTTNPNEQALIKNVNILFDQVEQEDTDESVSEVSYDFEKLHAYGKNFTGIINTNSYQIIPQKNSFDFVLTRDIKVLTAEIRFSPSENDLLHFVVDLSEKKVIDKTIVESKDRLSKIKDHELIDMAESISRMTIPLTNWDG